MKLKALPIAALLALTLTLTSCGDPGKFSDSEIISKEQKRDTDTAVTYNYADGASEPPKSYNSYTNAVESLSFNMLRKKFSQQNGESFVFSPSSTALQLSLLANGASADLRKEILLSFENLTTEEINQSASYFKSRMENVGKIALSQESGKKDAEKTLSMDGALFINDKTDVRSAFLQTNTDFYGDDIIRYDFSKGADKLKDRVGDKMTLSGEDSMASYSELSLSDTWLNQSLSSEEVSMQTKTARGIVKYTANNPLRALFIMPEGDFETYVKSFDSVEYSKLLESIDFTKRQAAVISSFRTEAQSANLSPVLQKIGLYTLFGENSDFGSLTHGGELTLNKFVCAAPSLSVGSSGIGSAATADSAEGEKPDGAWVFDKPFIFMLVDNETDIPIYISTVE